MIENRQNKYKQKSYKKARSNVTFTNSQTDNQLTPEQVVDVMLNQPEARLQDNPANSEMAQILIVSDNDSALQELFNLQCKEGIGNAIISQDVFHGNYPAKGGIIYPDDYFALGDMPTGDSIGIAISHLTGNILLVGPTKSAKTSLLIKFLSENPKLLKKIKIVTFVKKMEIRHIAVLSKLCHLVKVFKLGELALCYFEPPPGVPEDSWKNESIRLFAQCYERYSAQRLMGEKVVELMANHPLGIYPTLRQLWEILDVFKPRFGMREADYKASIIWCIIDLLNNTSIQGHSIWDYSSSTFLQEFYTTPGLCIIEAEALPQEHLSFIATYFMRWLYFNRVYSGDVIP